MSKVLLTLGILLVLGGLGHSAGVMHLYATKGLPEVNRMLLDIWIAEAQLLGGGLYLAAYHEWRTGSPWHALCAFGALTIIAFAVPIIPVLFLRAPLMFRVPLIIYLTLSVFILVRIVKSARITSSM